MKPRAPFTILVLALALAGLSASPASAREVFASDGCGTSLYKPVEMVMTCGDAGLRLESIEWTSWDRRSAAATATIRHRDQYDPSCDGLPYIACPIVEYPATVRLWRPVYCADRGRLQFTRLRALAPEDPEESSQDVRRSYRCSEYGKPKPRKPKPKRHRYWTDCGYPDVYNPVTVIVHRVRCAKAMRVVRAVWRLGQAGGVGVYISVKGFSCTHKLGGNRLHLCTQGSKVIRAPGAGCGSTCDPGNTWSRAQAGRERRSH